jgi:voltage-gated potassium channel
MDLKRTMERADTPAGHWVDRVIEALIVVSLVSFAIETLPDLAESTRDALRVVEIVIVAVFTVEYVLRIAVADNKLRFVTSFFGVVDLMAILPFYIAVGVDLRSVRAFRLLRLFRALKLARYSAAVRRFHVAFRIAKEEVILFFVVALMVTFLAAVGIYYFENPAQPERFKSVFHSLWWAVETLTTVGYGDVHPVTTGGKVFTFFVLMIGLGVVAVPTGLVASALGEARKLEADRELTAALPLENKDL